MNLLKEFNLFKKDKDEILEVIDFHCYPDTNLNDLTELFKRIKGKKITVEGIKNEPYTFIVKTISFSFLLEKQTISFLFNDTIYARIENGIKVWGKRIKTSEDPYGEEDWSE